MIDVTLLGTGGMMPLPGRALTSLYVRHCGKVVLIDCGEGTQTAIRAAGLRFKPIEAILITHFHGDHISGLPGLLLTLGNEGRTEMLTICGPQGLERIVRGLRVIVPELPFEIQYREFQEDTQFSCCGMSATAFHLNHGTPCFGYRFDLDRPGKFDPQAALAKGIPLEFWSRLQQSESIGGFTPADVLGAPRKGLRLLYATDTRPVDAIASYGQNADLLVLEGMFGEPEKQPRAIESHHMTMQEAAKLANDANAAALWLTHFSPATPTPEDFSEAIQAIFPNTIMGTDGLSATLKFQE